MLLKGGIKMLQPLNDNVFVEIYPSNDEKPTYADATIVELPENLEYILRVGDRVKVNLENAILLERRDNWTRRFIINYTDIIAVYKEKKENKEEKLTKAFEEKYQKDNNILLDTLIKEIGSIKETVDNVYIQLTRMKELGIDSISDHIKELEKDYILENKEEIESFLFVYRDLFPILQEAPSHIYRIFGKDVSIYLELSHDPECEDDKLVVTIKCPCSVEKSLKLEEKFYEWFMDYYAKTDKLLFTVE
jgi:hypothetical protein